MPQTVSVSQAHTDKVVINGVDLLNRKELSQSQNRELQRYIDENSHLLGFLDKEKDEKEEKESLPPVYTHSKYSSYSLGSPRHTSSAAGDYVDRDTQSLGRTNSPAVSDYGGKRKGVSWSDGVEKVDAPEGTPAQRARSHSPRRGESDNNTGSAYGMNGIGTQNQRANGFNHHQSTNPHPQSRLYSPAFSTSDKRRTPYDYDHSQNGGGADSPWGDNWSRTSKDSFGGAGADSANEKWKGFPSSEICAYSTLDRNPDDYNRYETHRYREQLMRRSLDRDDTKKFYGFGDHKVSGIELKPKRWTGGEIITDPTFVTKSLRPRRLFYSPIGDGVVAADGIELKRGPPDLTTKISVRHERIVEKGSPGQAGRRVYEHLWDEGSGRRGNEGEGDFGPQYTPLGGDGLGDGGRGGPAPDDGGRGGPAPDDGKKRGNDDGGRHPPPRHPPYDDHLSGPRESRPTSAMSDGQPRREGWTKTFITNPRELIHQYAHETPTNIFDIDDHTPRTITTYKETHSEVVD